MGNTTSRTITGIAMVVIGIFLIGLSFFVPISALWATLIYGIPILIIGLFLLFNTKEDKIEKIKTVERGKK